MTTINEAISHKELLNEIATLHNEALTRHLSQSELCIRFNQLKRINADLGQLQFDMMNDPQRGFRRVKMLTEEQAAIAYEEATDGCRDSLLRTRDNARQWQRVKPDPETNPLAVLDCEKVPTWDQPVPQATPLRVSTSAR